MPLTLPLSEVTAEHLPFKSAVQNPDGTVTIYYEGDEVLNPQAAPVAAPAAPAPVAAPRAPVPPPPDAPTWRQRFVKALLSH